MNVKTIKEYPVTISVVKSDEVIINDTQSALDFMMSLRHMTECNCITLNKDAICEDFFKLSTGVTGEILQKFANNKFKFAIVGDFSKYTSKPLRDFIYENNAGKQHTVRGNRKGSGQTVCGEVGAFPRIGFPDRKNTQ